MGAGNPFYRYYNGSENYEVSTYSIEYHDGKDPETGDYYSDSNEAADASASDWDWFTEDLASIAQKVGMELDQRTRDSESCAGYNDSATVVATGKYSKLLVMDDGCGRGILSLVPLKDWYTFRNEVLDDRWYQGWRKDGAAEADADRRWPIYEARYEAEFSFFMRALHAEYPSEYSIRARNGAWMSSGLPAYNPQQPYAFAP